MSVEKDIAAEKEQEHHLHCTFPVTGPDVSFQAIFICRTCSSSNQQDGEKYLCLCQACADDCHAEHDGLEYVGMGPAYCDCQKMKEGCRIRNVSEEEASRINITTRGSVIHRSNAAEMEDGYIRDVYSIPLLENEETLRQNLCEQAQELVKQSRETFWVDANDEASGLCLLERLALRVFQRHADGYKLDSSNLSGAEWWVQIKPISYPKPGHSRSEAYNNGSEAVDLHYDKDEALAESFGLGAFPTLSTVTYLTGSLAPPTVIFPHCYEEQDDMVSDMMVSHPRRGKHLVFDGRLLHGAPTHYALRQVTVSDTTSIEQDMCRITFLVNLWIGHKPAGVQPLPDKISQAINKQGAGAEPSVYAEKLSDASFKIRPVYEQTIAAEESGNHRIELPFVGKGTTSWEDDTQLVLSTYPQPILADEDTVLVRYGPDLQAYICAPGDEDVDSDKEDNNGAS